MALFVNSNQVASSDEERYARMVSYLVCLRELIEKGITISKLKEMNDAKAFRNFKNYAEFPDSDIIDKCIEIVSSDMSVVTSAEDKLLYDVITTIIQKYNLADMHQLIVKLKEFENNSDAMYTLANSINNVIPNQITDTQSLVTYVTELVKNAASVQNNANNMFLNFNAALNENAILKAQIQNYKQQLANLGVTC